jgi:hypothetical protein
MQGEEAYCRGVMHVVSRVVFGKAALGLTRNPWQARSPKSMVRYSGAVTKDIHFLLIFVCALLALGQFIEDSILPIWPW